jgi:hypothetical protein
MSWLQKDNLLSNEQNVFGFTTKLFGAEICIAIIQQAQKFIFIY